MTSEGPSRIPGVDSFIEETIDRDSLARVCRLFGSVRRQLVILYLLELGADEWVSVGEIAKWIGGHEDEKPPEAITGQPYNRVRTSLVQVHLEKLADTSIIRYNDNRQRVRHGPQFEQSARYLLILLLALKSD